MPLPTKMGEQLLNPSLGEDQPGGGVFLVRDSDYDVFGLLTQFDGSAQQFYAFFIEPNGTITPRFYLGEDRTFEIAAYDQDAFLIYPADRDFETFPPIVVRADGSRYEYEGNFADYPPSYRLDGAGLRSVAGGGVAGQATQTQVANGNVRVYEAPDGDGSGVFLAVTDDAGNRIGGVVRVNADTAGDQVAPIVQGHDEGFSVAWTQSLYDGMGAEEYRAATFDLGPNIGLAIAGDAGNDTHAGDAGDFVTDIFFWDTGAGGSLGRDRIVDFGANDILVTTSPILDRNGDGIVTFGSDRRLDLSDGEGRAVGELAIAGVRALEFDGVKEGEDGTIYYVYSKIGSAADEYYLIV